MRFQVAFRAVIERMPYVADDLISIAPNLDELLPLTMELSQPTYSINSVGKIMIDKAPDGMRSPNLADAVMIAYQPASRALEVWMRIAEQERAAPSVRW
jgi:phage terminase large subunit